MSLGRLWASWRSEYVKDATAQNRSSEQQGCVFCELLAQEPSPANGIIAVGEHAACVLNAFPYGSGHLLILPRRHEASLSALDETESNELWAFARRGVAAVEAAFCQ